MTTIKDVLDCPIGDNSTTVRQYLTDLLDILWNEGETFSPKRPFGNSGWRGELRNALVEEGLADYDGADQCIRLAIQSFAKSSIESDNVFPSLSPATIRNINDRVTTAMLDWVDENYADFWRDEDDSPVWTDAADKARADLKDELYDKVYGG